ncbi:MAG: hypothetical protein HY071_02935 [Chloroflexi bacterium]|nr:hypothetical protein [Chloroflexota bacterium]
MSETAEFPLPADVTEEERETAKREIGRHTTVTEAKERVVRFEGELIGQTGPIWHFQYTRMYKLPKGYLVAAHDLREGIRVAFADDPAKLSASFDQEAVREFIDDELRFRKVLPDEHRAEQPVS